MGKELAKIFKAAEAQGFTVSRTKSNHYTVYKDGARVTTFAGTASDQRSIKNGLAYMRRAGFIWPP
ncbi:hypothetical protein [Glaciihabitans sp. dw_435]|uniref:hypothetical protein n=1 Tax=Glaciihabitans sp. dw_435 TaxID=2720081 RepID=UPI001BD47DAD|nr:hypothetical protein [Glaciihabitans sp. dw_435]